MAPGANLVVLIIISGIVLLISTECHAASFEDSRCKCVCDKQGKDARTVYVNTTRSEQCDCEHVVHPVSPLMPCSRCLCRTETRNTTTIKVLVIFIICVVSMLCVYMLFLMCLDPLLQKRPGTYHQHTNEEVNMEVLSSRQSDEVSEPPSSLGAAEASTSASARQRSLLNMVTKEQKKWKGTVQEQRRNIYDRHAMLN